MNKDLVSVIHEIKKKKKTTQDENYIQTFRRSSALFFDKYPNRLLQKQTRAPFLATIGK